MHLVYANRRVLYRTTARSLVATAGAAPCCCPGVGSACCHASILDDPCGGPGRCCNCGSEYVAIREVFYDAGFAMTNGSPRRSRVTIRTYSSIRVRCVDGVMVPVVEYEAVDGVVRAYLHSGQGVEGGVLASDVRGAYAVGGCPPLAIDLVQNMLIAENIGAEALSNRWIEAYGGPPQEGFPFPFRLACHTGSPASVFDLYGHCGTPRDVSGCVLSPAGIIGPGSSFSAQVRVGCGLSRYTSGGSWSINGGEGLFSWSVRSTIDVQVIVPCNPDPCTGGPPPPPPPPPPGYGACYLQDGTCVVSTLMDCVNQRYGPFLRYAAGENCDSGRPVRMGLGDAFRVILGGGR